MEIGSKQAFEDSLVPWEGMPNTRFQGSKKKLLPELYSILSKVEFETCLDAFGGTGSVSYLMKQMGKAVTYNDIMPSNVIMAEALLSNKETQMDEVILKSLFEKQPDRSYQNIIEENYRGIYFTEEENTQIDVYCQNVHHLSNQVLKSEAYYLLFQSLLSKRPYNLFHRANLDMRMKEVTRSFGNKVTWDKPIFEHCKKFLFELRKCRSHISKTSIHFKNKSAFEIKNEFDLVYIDTPYAKSSGTQESNYFNFYHFLDALLSYETIPSMIQKEIKHKPFYEFNKNWFVTEDIDSAFQLLFSNFKKSHLVISYRNDGYPSVDRMVEILNSTHSRVETVNLASYKYVLSTKNKDTKEIAIVAKARCN
jgi:adenine-specific DNA methylase